MTHVTAHATAPWLTGTAAWPIGIGAARTGGRSKRRPYDEGVEVYGLTAWRAAS